MKEVKFCRRSAVLSVLLLAILFISGCDNPSSPDAGSPVTQIPEDSTVTPLPVISPPSSEPLHVSLDPLDPVYFYGNEIEYRGEKITLGPNTVYLDGSMSDAQIANFRDRGYNYVYNNFRLAAPDFRDGVSAEEPMRVLLAPYVYWIDDPSVYVISGTYGLTINCDYMTWEGLTYNPAYVDICSYRGETLGAEKINYTNFRIVGNDFTLKNLTIGNYCVADLVYELKPELGMPRRTDAIMTHAQLISYQGDRAFAQRTRFVGRLNLYNIYGGDRAMYDHCHFELTDDSLEDDGVYLNCDFDLYGKFPFYNLNGAVMLNCQFRSHIQNEPNVRQYVTKNSGSGAFIDCTFVTDIPDLELGWLRDITQALRSYQYNVTLNGNPYIISSDTAGVTVDLKNYPELLKAYKFTYNGETVYNTFNLLRGGDDWDPMGVKETVLEAGYGSIPKRMTVRADRATIETASASNAQAELTVTVNADKNSSAVANAGEISYSIYQGADGAAISGNVITANNTTYRNIPVIAEARSAIGLHAAVIITARPELVAAPAFSVLPAITLNSETGKLKVSYTLNMAEGFDDISEISWYRCDDASGTNPVPVAVSRLDVPEYEYTLVPGDLGKFIMAGVKPKHNISVSPGTEEFVTYSAAIASGYIKNPGRFTTNFQNFPDAVQAEVKAGYWMNHSFRYNNGSQPLGSLVRNSANMPNYTPDNDTGRWYYEGGSRGTGGGAGVYGFISGNGNGRGARLAYTPLDGVYGDMSLTLVAAPEKVEGQGFGGAGGGMDIMIKFDTATSSGYGVRLNRISAFSDAIVVNLIKIENGTVTYLTDNGMLSTPVSEAVGVSAYRTDCTIVLKQTGNKLSVELSTSAPQTSSQIDAGHLNQFFQEVEITPNTYGGIHIHHWHNRGTDGWTFLRNMDIEWK